ncbi:MAG: hypothetical protein IE881_06370 [Epsilonproteobacteria bacterium]|nr:hypothetical protein [Campylobacterota bacterium]
MKKNDKTVGGGYIDKVVLYIQKNRMQTFYNLMLLLVIFIQLPFTVAGLDSVTVEVDLPPKGTVIVQNDTANSIYYQIWGEHYTNNEEYFFSKEDGTKTKFPYTASLVTFDYTNVEQKYSDFLKRYKPSKLLKDQKIYQSFIKNIKVKMISQKFDVEEIQATSTGNGHTGEVVIKGVAHQTAASTPMGDKACKYVLTFERIGGKNYGTSINTDCFN